ncbi:hypothetical protein V1478_007621 [Vespula squamosa]|uniref:Uncharacterized protein n=1 Tax=Vespula squamosa TaxID=30214 RepID=A0ABD2B3R9_VESSQ
MVRDRVTMYHSTGHYDVAQPTTAHFTFPETSFAFSYAFRKEISLSRDLYLYPPIDLRRKLSLLMRELGRSIGRKKGNGGGAGDGSGDGDGDGDSGKKEVEEEETRGKALLSRAWCSAKDYHFRPNENRDDSIANKSNLSFS